MLITTLIAQEIASAGGGLSAAGFKEEVIKLRKVMDYHSITNSTLPVRVPPRPPYRLRRCRVHMTIGADTDTCAHAASSWCSKFQNTATGAERRRPTERTYCRLSDHASFPARVGRLRPGDCKETQGHQCPTRWSVPFPFPFLFLLAEVGRCIQLLVMTSIN